MWLVTIFLFLMDFSEQEFVPCRNKQIQGHNVHNESKEYYFVVNLILK
jgi:hypothetical protein